MLASEWDGAERRLVDCSTWYDYERQCWIVRSMVVDLSTGQVVKGHPHVDYCGHPKKSPACYACEHGGEYVWDRRKRAVTWGGSFAYGEVTS